MSYIEQLEKGTNYSRTQNNALTNASSLDALLDFFSLAGAMRERPADVVKLFEKAYYQDKQSALRALFYIRDVREGQGERHTFRVCFMKLQEIDSNVAQKALHWFSEYGRWDDLLVAVDFTGSQAVTKEAIRIINAQLSYDLINMDSQGPVSLLAKWLPSENATKRDTIQLAHKVMKGLELTPSQYRKKLSALRAYIKILETYMSKNSWSDVDYEKLPSQAMRKHVKAFQKHDKERYTSFLEAVNAGKKKMNAGAVYPYEIFEMIKTDRAAANGMWKNLPDWTSGKNALVLADTSNSMNVDNGRPLATAVSLALYFAERNKGPFHNYFMTFSEQSKLQRVVGSTLYEKLVGISNAHWDMNTNLNLAFRAILDAAIRNNASQEDMPAMLYVISDMEFDSAFSGSNEHTNFEAAKQMFEQAGYALPHVVFWNVHAMSNQAPATKYDGNVTLISGSSATTFKYALESKTPIDSMMEVLNSKRYKAIAI